MAALLVTESKKGVCSVTSKAPMVAETYMKAVGLTEAAEAIITK